MSKLQIILGYIERYFSLIISIGFFLLVLKYKNSFQFIYNLEFLDKLISIGAALFAFLLTILTIIVQSESESIKRIKAHSGYPRFLRFNRRIVFLFLSTTIVSVILSFMQHILKYVNDKALFILADINTSLFFWATLDSIYFTFLFYVLIMLDTKK